MRKFGLKVSIAVVFLLSSASLFSYWKGWFSDFTLNLGTELIGILITVVFIDLVISRHEQREKSKLRRIALRQLRVPMQRHLSLLFNMYKASVTAPATRSINGPETLFREDYYLQLASFDLSKDAPVIPKQQWIDYACHEVNEFRESLSRTLEKYAMHLDSEVIDLLESLLGSSFLSFLKQVPNIRNIDRNEGLNRSFVFFGAPGMKDMIERHTDLFSRLVKLFNSEMDQADHVKLSSDIWRNDVSPQIGSARSVA